MYYLIIFIVLFLIEELYFKIAEKYNIIDQPNNRSLHTKITIRGGGIIYWVSISIYFLFSNYRLDWFYVGITLISLIGFIDDIKSVSSMIRLFFQLIATICLGLQFPELFQLAVWQMILLLFISIGVFNAYNFMDGVNGITALYSLSVISFLAYLNNTNYPFIDNQFLILVAFGLIIFLFYNFRKQAKCFGGDVGSLGMSFIILFLIGKLIIQSNDYKYILLIALYGLDTGYTMLYRIREKQNIFEAHKLHFFQILVYKFKLTHLQVAILYSSTQMGLNFLLLFFKQSAMCVLLPYVVILFLIHYLRKRQKLSITIK